MNVLKSVILSMFTTFILSISAYAESKNNALNTLNALNHAITSIYRVEQFPSKAIIDEEYNNIINNIAWGNITADLELLNLFTEMMNIYTENLLDAKDKELLKRQYEAQVNRAFFEVKPIEHIKSEAKLSTARNVVDNFSLFNPASWLGSGVRAGLGIGEYELALQANDRLIKISSGSRARIYAAEVSRRMGIR